MAIVQSNVLQSIKGKIGNLVFYRTRGQDRIRSCPPQPQTSPPAGLEAHCRRMRAAVALYRANRNTVIPAVWKEAARGKTASGYNLFVGANMQAYDGHSRKWDYALLQPTAGKLNLPHGLSVKMTGENRMAVTWKWCKPCEATRENDLLQVFVLEEGGVPEIRALSLPAVCRKTGRAEFELPADRGRKMHLYLCFCDHKKIHYSKCRYFPLEKQN